MSEKVTTLRTSIAKSVGYERTMKAALEADGLMRVAYQTVGLDAPDPADRAPSYRLRLLTTDGKSVLEDREIDQRVPRERFDIAVDSTGRTHIASVRRDGNEWVLRHSYVSDIKTRIGDESPRP